MRKNLKEARQKARKNIVRENRKGLEQIQLFEKKLNNMYCIADYLKETRTEVEKQKCNLPFRNCVPSENEPINIHF